MQLKIIYRNVIMTNKNNKQIENNLSSEYLSFTEKDIEELCDVKGNIYI